MKHIPSNQEISEIAALAALQLCRVELVKDLEDKLKIAQADLRQTQEVDLPNAMHQAGVSEIKLPSGEKISVKEDIYASLPRDERFYEAMDWLRDNGFGDVIKNEVKVLFGKGEDDLSKEAVQILKSNGFDNVAVALTVHAQTLKALVREQLAKGGDFPMELFSVIPVSKAIIK